MSKHLSQPWRPVAMGTVAAVLAAGMTVAPAHATDTHPHPHPHPHFERHGHAGRHP
ncbi:hypothetical protein [Bifidobacterium cuniculi]|uniref:hypothetical protein n=1 Tax=Bifidobacterium cuniculi TaxID=1688 RepID=UPI0012E053E4|nr:hypothetical protein [Bifidobacterium cuniculi]